MKWIFLFLFCPGLSWAEAQLRQVSLEVDTLLGATSYELQVQNLKTKYDRSIKSESPTFEIQLPIGKFQVRSRAQDQRGVFGPWSAFEEVLVLPSPKFESSEKIQTTASSENLSSKVDLKWKAVDGISKYQVQIQNKEGTEDVKKIETKDSKIQVDLPAGIYSYQVKAITDDGLESVTESLPGARPLIVIEGGQLPNLEVKKFDPIRREIAWKQKPGERIRAQVEYRPHLNDEFKTVDLFEDLKSPWKPPFARNGVYRIQFWSEAPGWKSSARVTQEFVLKPTDL